VSHSVSKDFSSILSDIQQLPVGSRDRVEFNLGERDRGGASVPDRESNSGRPLRTEGLRGTTGRSVTWLCSVDQVPNIDQTALNAGGCLSARALRVGRKHGLQVGNRGCLQPGSSVSHWKRFFKELSDLFRRHRRTHEIALILVAADRV
jgi:hypothetical protein